MVPISYIKTPSHPIGECKEDGTITTNTIDDLVYGYGSGSRLTSVTDNASEPDFKNQGVKPHSGNYIYDNAGRMTYDPHRRLTIRYNHLDLPRQITGPDGKTTEITYDATGRKWLQKKVKDATMYVGVLSFQKKNGNGYRLEAANVGDGRIVYDEEERELFNEYFHKDHLGNIRLAFTDRNENGKVELLDDDSEVTQQNDFYPFGMAHSGEGLFHGDVGKNRFKFNEIEQLEGIGLELAPFRSYDAAVGRWGQVDPMAEEMPSMTPYRFGFNNPILWSDPLGLFESKKEARKHKKAEGLSGRVRKQEDGRYGIVNKKDHSITIDDGELGVITAGYVHASGVDANPSGTNDFGGPALNIQDFVYNERRDAYENQQKTDFANFSNKLSGPPVTGTPLGGLVGPGGAAKGGSFFMKMLDGLGRGQRVKTGRKFLGNQTFLEYYKALYREGFRRVPGLKGTGKVQDMVNSATGEVISIRHSGYMSGAYKGYDTFFQTAGKSGKSNMIFIK